MPEIFTIVDRLMSVLNLAQSVDTEDEKQERATDEVMDEQTKEKIDHIIEQREQEIKTRRADQSNIADQHRQQHKR